ncbi:hypothetical protein SMICM304S_04620 [Streptomyces microflavus]
MSCWGSPCSPGTTSSTTSTCGPTHCGAGSGAGCWPRCREAARGPLNLYVFQRNTAARAFYERHGFTAVAFDDGGRNRENEPDVLYHWAPGAP